MGNAPSSTSANAARLSKENTEKSELSRRAPTYPLLHNKTIPFIDDGSSTHNKPGIGYAPSSRLSPHDGATFAYQVFLKAFPEYQLTWILDTLRRTDFSRLDETGETYVDYMGGSIYPESLLRSHIAFLNANVLGNTHSVSNR